MFEVQVQADFSAAHAITIGGVREALHGHNWRVVAVVTGDQLDSDGLLADFHVIERTLREIVAPFVNRNLNEVHPFDRVNPSAERVAEFIANELHDRLRDQIPRSVRVASVRVREAVHCEATYRFPIGHA